MEFNYEEALKRTKINKSDVDKLRGKIKKFKNVPCLSDKKVSEERERENSIKKIDFLAFVLLISLQWN